MSPALGDASDGTISYSTRRNLHGWSIEEWIAFLLRHPDASTPNGVARALITYYEEELSKQPIYSYFPESLPSNRIRQP